MSAGGFTASTSLLSESLGVSGSRILTIGTGSLEQHIEVDQKQIKIADERFQWKSTRQFITLLMASVLSVKSFIGFFGDRSNPCSEPTVLHYVLVGAFVAFPISYMQVLIGQYTKLGTVSFKHIGPIGQCVAVTFIVNNFLHIVRNCHLLGDFTLYTLASFLSDLSWLTCPTEASAVRCWNSTSNCTKNCINESVHLPTYVYFNDIIWNKPIRDPAEMRLGLSHFFTIMKLFVMWCITGLFLAWVVKSYRKMVIYAWVTAMFVLGLFFVGVVVTRTNLVGVRRLCRIQFRSLFTVETWCKAIFRCVRLFGLGRPIYVLYGSHIPNKIRAKTICGTSFALTFLVIAMFTIVTETCMAIVEKVTNSDDNHLQYVQPNIDEEVYFVTILQALGHLRTKKLWTLLFLTGAIIMTLTAQIIYINVTEAAIRDIYPHLSRYKNYIVAAICIVAFTLGVIPLSRGRNYSYYLMYMNPTSDILIYYLNVDNSKIN